LAVKFIDAAGAGVGVLVEPAVGVGVGTGVDIGAVVSDPFRNEVMPPAIVVAAAGATPSIAQISIGAGVGVGTGVGVAVFGRLPSTVSADVIASNVPTRVIDFLSSLPMTLTPGEAKTLGKKALMSASLRFFSGTLR